ncbi:MAG: hypothetical protein NTV43_02315 [Methylococcales bacterium]|nr:hypothetical protein [Methylococcales bacterium]
MAQISPVAFAKDKQISYRLEKTSSTGFTAPEQASSSLCVLYPNGNISITQTAGGLTSVRRDKLSVKGDLSAIVAAAAQGELNTAPYPADANSISYRAFADKLPPYVKFKPIVLFEKNGGTGVETVNNSPAASTLRNFMDMNCQTPTATQP